jgi:hypothetical protein
LFSRKRIFVNYNYSGDSIFCKIAPCLKNREEIYITTLNPNNHEKRN